MSLFTGAALLGAGLAAATGTAVAAKVGSNAASRAGDLNAAAADKELAYLQAKDAQDQRNFQQTQSLNLDQYNQKEARLAPYRSIGAGATGTLADLIGAPMVQVPSGAAPPPGSAVPAGFSSSTAPTPSAPATPALGGAPSAPGVPGVSGASANPADLIQQGARELGLRPDDPQALGKLAAYLSAHGVAASVMPSGSGAPSDHKLWINGAGWTAISSNGYQPGTYRFDPYQQVAASGAFDPRTGVPTGASGGGTSTGPSATSASAASGPGFSVMPGSPAPTLASLYARTAPLTAGY